MKLEIDLTDLLQDENGDPTESLASSIRRQVVEHIAKEVKKTTSTTISQEVARVLDETLKSAVAEQMPGIIANLLDQTFTPVSRFGERGTLTTFRTELLRKIQEEMVYKKANYDSEKNTFTKAIDDTVRRYVEDFKTSFNKEVDAKFIDAAMSYATEKLRERLSLPKSR